jgi:hypothetical protein
VIGDIANASESVITASESQPAAPSAITKIESTIDDHGDSQPEERKRDMSEEVSTRSSKRLENNNKNFEPNVNQEYKDGTKQGMYPTPE